MDAPQRRRELRIVAAAALIAAHAGCASLGGLGSLVQAPQFSAVEGRDAEIVLRGPSRDFPLGGAAVRLHARVFNPNPFGLTLSTLVGDLFLDGTRAAAVDFPLGLSLVANDDAEIPIDLVVGFRGRPAPGPGRGAGVSGSRLDYRLDGRIGVDAGPLGRPTFGPMTILEGDVRVRSDSLQSPVLFHPGGQRLEDPRVPGQGRPGQPRRARPARQGRLHRRGGGRGRPRSWAFPWWSRRRSTPAAAARRGA